MDKPLKSLKFPGLPDTYVIPEAKDGASAYELAVQQGFTGSLDDWLASLKGDPGTDFTVKAYYESLSALESAVPTPVDGDMYGVGTAAPYDIYVWDAVHGTWVNNGEIQGPTGPQGDPGPNTVTAETTTVLSGLLKGNGTNVTVAQAGTDYEAPPAQVTSGTQITLADNTEYRLTDVQTLTLAFPTGNFECWLRIQTAASGTVSVTFPAAVKYIGEAPSFGAGETWELSIKDGVVIAVKEAS